MRSVIAFSLHISNSRTKPKNIDKKISLFLIYFEYFKSLIFQRFVFGFDFYFTVHVMLMQDTPNSNAPFLRRSSENSAKKRSYGNDIVLRPKHCSFYMEQKPIIDPKAIAKKSNCSAER